MLLITPELSRPAERDRRWFNHSASAETAKRARLERIVMPHSGTRRGQLSGPLGKFLNLAFCGLKHWPSSSVKSPWLRGYSTCATTDWPFANNRSEMPSLSSMLVLRSAGQAKPSVFSTNASSWYGPTTQTLSQSVGTAAFRSIRLLPEASNCSEILSE